MTTEPTDTTHDSRQRVPAASASPTPQKKRDWKLIAIGVLVLVALVGSLAAWMQGKASRQPSIDELTAERDGLAEEKAAAEAAAEELRGRIRELEARRQVSHAVEELVARNFGSARESLQNAGRMLRAGGHGELAARVAAVELIPTDDVGEQRDGLLALGRDVDAAIGE